MEVIIDTREHKSELPRIEQQLTAAGATFARSKLYCGDYMSLDNARHVVDRKKNLQELCGNVCQQHERFKAELVRAQQMGIKITILCEHGGTIHKLEDVYFWQNPRRKVSPKAMNGDRLYKVLDTIRTKYGVEFEFCDKRSTGRRIVEILSDGQNRLDEGKHKQTES